MITDSVKAVARYAMSEADQSGDLDKYKLGYDTFRLADALDRISKIAFGDDFDQVEVKLYFNKKLSGGTQVDYGMVGIDYPDGNEQNITSGIVDGLLADCLLEIANDLGRAGKLKKEKEGDA